MNVELIHTVVQQNKHNIVRDVRARRADSHCCTTEQTQHCKAVTLQLKKKTLLQ